MTFKVFQGETFIGHSELEGRDPAMGVAFGRFIPSTGYRTIQRECIDNHFDQSALRLAVRTPDDEQISCVGVAILDFSEKTGSEEDIELNVVGISQPPYEKLFPEHLAKYEQQFQDED
ncbi:MAG: hypothetical protein J5I65_03750 [Aridibacter famidurans]|nr:hypothetical protein [Aridibacter famidurans]